MGKYDVTATFFLVGDWVDNYPDSTKALHDAGQEIMSHSDTHPHISKLTNSEIENEVNASCEKIEAITDTRPSLFRCPFGEYDDHVISSVKSQGLIPIQWDVEVLEPTSNT